MITIRPFQPGDTSAVASVIVTIQQQEFGIGISLEQQPDLLDVPGYYQRGNGNFWVAEDSGTIVGTIALLDIGHRQVALRKMFVAPAYRGGQPGVAARLLDTLLDWADQRGVQAVFLGTTDRFLAAHRFYEKHGFLEIARTELPHAFPVMEVDSKFYQLRLG